MSHNSTAKIDQKEYLKKYLSGDKNKKKKKKDKKYDRHSHAKVRLIDDDAVAQDVGAYSDDDLLYGEDAPQIVGEYIETEPNRNGSSKWRSIAAVKDEVQIKRESSPESRWGKRIEHRKIKDEYSPRRERRNRSPDISPPRKREKPVNPFKAKTPDLSPVRSAARFDRSQDHSPTRSNPFKKNARGRSSSADLSPKRNQNRRHSIERRHRAGSADLSPPRLNPFRRTPPSKDFQLGKSNRIVSPNSSRRAHTKLSNSPRRKLSPARHQRISNDLSPPRRRIDSQSPRRQFSRDQSPPRRPQHPYAASSAGRKRSADLSPPRKQRWNSRERQRGAVERTNFERPDNRRQNGSSKDRYRSISSGSSSHRRREHSRQRQQRSRSAERATQRNRFESSQKRHSPDRRPVQRTPPRRRDSDQSPHRRKPYSTAQKPHSPRIKREKRSHSHDRPKIHWETAAVAQKRNARRSRSDSPPPTHKPKAVRTLDGKKAGLQDAQALKEETAARRREEDRMFEKMSREISGRDAEIAVRSTGRRGQRDSKPEDPEKQRRREEREKQKKEQYERWGKGLKQIEDHRARLEEQAYESSKPLARYENDADLERHLREQERLDDPMLEYMRRKKKEKAKDSSSSQKPVYEGSYPENRFGIRPGYRWDGVDRSNGYEKKWFDVQNSRRAGQEEAYKYSVEDM